MNEFQERYKSFDNRKLLKILEEPESYQPLAIEAAKLELSKREVSEDETQSVKDEINDRKVKVEKRQEQIKKVESKVKSIGTEFFETVSPIQEESQTIDRKINLIVIVFGFLSIYQFFQEFGVIRYLFTDNLAEWALDMIFYIIPLIGLPVAVFLFWKRNKIGWILMSAFFVYTIVNAIGLFLLTWNWSQQEKYTSDYSTDNNLIEVLDHLLLPQRNPIEYVLVALVFGATLWVITKEDVRSEFKVDVKSSLLTIGVSFLITFIFMSFV